MWAYVVRDLWKSIVKEFVVLISTRVAQVCPGWLYFEFFLQLNFQFVPKRRRRRRKRL